MLCCPGGHTCFAKYIPIFVKSAHHGTYQHACLLIVRHNCSPCLWLACCTGLPVLESRLVCAALQLAAALATVLHTPVVIHGMARVWPFNFSMPPWQHKYVATCRLGCTVLLDAPHHVRYLYGTVCVGWTELSICSLQRCPAMQHWLMNLV